MSKARRKFTTAEKSKIALEAIKGELTISEIASKYMVHLTQINKWKKLALTQIPEAFTGKQKQVEKRHTSELSALYEQVGRLKVENEFLKKSVTCLPVDRRPLLEPAHPTLSIREQCRLLGVNRSSLYYRPVERNEFKLEKLNLLNLVDETYTEHPFMGTRMMADYLQLQGLKSLKRHHTR